MNDGKDNMVSFFKKSFEDFEDLPSKDLWKDISSQIPTYGAGALPESLISETTKTAVSSGSKTIQTFGAILTKKALIISGSAIMATMGSYVTYNTLSSNNQVEPTTIKSITPGIIIDSTSVETNDTQIENTISSDKTSESNVEEVTGSSEKKQVEIIETKEEVLEEARVPLKINSIQKVEHLAAPKDTMSAPKEVIEEKKPVKKETFYEKNAKKHKDSSRNVFSPE